MISFVKGTVADIGENCLVVENGGIGYEIYMTGQDLGKARIGDEKKIHTFLYVREDILQLYGFFSKDDLGMFKLLIGVNGVGPKGALGILSGISADELRFAVLSDDVKTISKAPGIGKKTAQKMILELKDKLKLEDAFEMKLAHQQEEAAEGASDLRDSRQEAVEALVALGYSSADALRAVRKVPEDVPADDVEARAAVKAAAEYVGPVYMRFGRLAVPVINDEANYKFEIGKGITLKEGKDVTIIATGLEVNESLEAAKLLEADGISAEVINIHTIKPLDKELVVASAKKTGKVVTVEEHSVIGGLGGAVAEALSEEAPTKMLRIGMMDKFGQSGPAKALIEYYGLDGKSIYEKVKAFL